MNRFARLFRLLHLRHLLRFRGRTLAVVLGIALGAAVFTGVRLAVHASLTTFSRSVELVAGRADRALVRPGGRVPETLLAPLLSQPAVAAATPVMSAYVHATTGGSQHAVFLLLGIDPLLDRTFRSWRAEASGAGGEESWRAVLRDPGAVILADALARRLAVASGDDVSIAGPHAVRVFKVAGVLAPQGLSHAEGGELAIVDLATFQELFGLHGVVDRIDLRLTPGVRPTQLERLAASLPAGVRLAPPTEMRQSALAMIHAYRLNLTVLSFASLVVGMFLVYSLVALNAAARRQELAVLRAVGASARLIFTGFLIEGAALGVAGWLLSLPLAALLLPQLLEGVSRTISTLFVRVRAVELALPPAEIVLSLATTVLVSVLAALAPARAAMRVAPVEVLGSASGAPLQNRPPWHLTLWAAACLALALPLTWLPHATGLPLPGYLATMLILAAFSLLAPWLLRQAGRLLGPRFRRAGMAPAWLATRYVGGSATRIAVSLGALITAVALFASLVIMVHSFRETVRLWTRQTISGDLFVAPRLAEINHFRDPLPANAVAVLEQLDAQADVVPNRRFSLLAGSLPYQLEGLDMALFFRHGDFFYAQGDADGIRPQLTAGAGVVVSEVYANRSGLSIGQRFRAEVDGAFVDLPILGIIRDYRTHGGVVFCDLGVLQRLLPGLRYGAARLYLHAAAGTAAARSSLAEIRQRLAACCGTELELIDGELLRSSVLRIFDETFAVTSVLLAIALAVAALGIATTLTVMVLERRRELLTLAALGASRGQLRALIAWEAALLVLAGEAAGMACGLLLSHVLVFVVNRQSFGWTFLYRADARILLLSLPLIAATALAAALPAMRLMLRQPPAAVLRER
jgi:putative ABC transport system permease protein